MADSYYDGSESYYRGDDAGNGKVYYGRNDRQAEFYGGSDAPQPDQASSGQASDLGAMPSQTESAGDTSQNPAQPSGELASATPPSSTSGEGSAGGAGDQPSAANAGGAGGPGSTGGQNGGATQPTTVADADGSSQNTTADDSIGGTATLASGLIDGITGAERGDSSGGLSGGVSRAAFSLGGPADQLSGFGSAGDGLSDLLDDAGLISDGAGSNLLGSIAAAPGALLAGGSFGSALDPVFTGAGDVLDVVSQLGSSVALGGVGSVLGATGGVLDATGNVADALTTLDLGDGTGLGTVTGVVNEVSLGATDTLNGIGTATPGLVQGLTDTAESGGIGHLGTTGPDGDSNLLTSAVAAPGAILAEGNVESGLNPVIENAGDTLDTAGGFVTGAVGALDGTGGTASPVAGLVPQVVDGITDTLGDTTAIGGGGSPILAGLANSDGDTLNGVLGAATGAGMGGATQPLVTAEAGNGTAPSIVSGNVLSAGDASSSPVEVNALNTTQPTLLDAGALSGGDQLAFASLNGTGADSLAGGLLDTAPLPAAAPLDAAEAGGGLTADLGALDIAIADVGHSDPHADVRSGPLLSGLGI